MSKYLQSTTKPDVWFKIISYNPETKMARLKSRYTTEFEHCVSADTLKKYNYTITDKPGAGPGMPGE